MLTITIGTWVIPLLITFIVFGWSFTQNDGGYLSGFFETLIALIISLLAWLIWAILILMFN